MTDEMNFFVWMNISNAVHRCNGYYTCNFGKKEKVHNFHSFRPSVVMLELWSNNVDAVTANIIIM